VARQAGDNDFTAALLCTDDAAAVVKFTTEGHAATMIESTTALQRVERFKGRALASL
jgi:hypothetical protein